MTGSDRYKSVCNGCVLDTGGNKKRSSASKLHLEHSTTQVFVQQLFVNCLYYLASKVKDVC